MLQIISGKFLGNGEIVHNECNGILSSYVTETLEMEDKS